MICCCLHRVQSVQDHVGNTEPVKVMDLLRTEKNNFKPKK